MHGRLFVRSVEMPDKYAAEKRKMYQDQMIQKAKDLEKIAGDLTASLQSAYVLDKVVKAQDVARIEKLYHQAMSIRQAAERANNGL